MKNPYVHTVYITIDATIKHAIISAVSVAYLCPIFGSVMCTDEYSISGAI